MKGPAVTSHPQAHTQALDGPARSDHHEGPESFACPVCTQPFSSAKSVHGHMWKHRDRGWRGMRPPRHHHVLPLGPHSSNGQPKLLTLPGWPRQSGRHAKALGNGGGIDISISQEQASTGGGSGAHKRLYACSVCGRSFKSYQAFGGHRSHHVKMEKIRSSSVDDDGVESVGVASNSWAIVPYVGPAIFNQVQSAGEVPGDHEQEEERARVLWIDLNERPPEWIE